MFALRRLFTHYYVILRACFDFIIVEQNWFAKKYGVTYFSSSGEVALPR
ncbi:MAG: hypothetical protein BACD_02035 [Bacteroides rodentium]